jgi:hypothetical protein
MARWPPDVSVGSRWAGSRPEAEQASAASWALPCAHCLSCAGRSPLRAPRLRVLRRRWALEAVTAASAPARWEGLARSAGQGRLRPRAAERAYQPPRPAMAAARRRARAMNDDSGPRRRRYRPGRPSEEATLPAWTRGEATPTYRDLIEATKHEPLIVDGQQVIGRDGQPETFLGGPKPPITGEMLADGYRRLHEAQMAADRPAKRSPRGGRSERSRQGARPPCRTARRKTRSSS